jgi:hypothetical protein
MSSKSHRTAGAKSRRRAKPVDLSTARRMLPLVLRIASDIVQDHRQLDRFSFELNGLDRDKRNLSWPERERRYAVQSEVTRLQTRLEEQKKELDSLGAVLVDPVSGAIDFPTFLNGRPAYYSWQIGENTVEFWHFDGESTRRPIPPNWNESSQLRLVGLR